MVGIYVSNIHYTGNLKSSNSLEYCPGLKQFAQQIGIATTFASQSILFVLIFGNGTYKF